MRVFLAIAALIFTACSAAPEKKAEAPPPAPPPVKDDTALLPTANRIGARVAPDHLPGIGGLPGGTIGEYDVRGTKYRLFIIETDTAQDAAILLLDAKSALKDPAYISYMGGYYGAGSDGPVYVFAKTKYLAGVAGLARDKADPVARELAAQLH